MHRSEVTEEVEAQLLGKNLNTWNHKYKCVIYIYIYNPGLQITKESLSQTLGYAVQSNQVLASIK
jgi:hypothetical protein